MKSATENLRVNVSFCKKNTKKVWFKNISFNFYISLISENKSKFTSVLLNEGID